jgi:hypothetical protein
LNKWSVTSLTILIAIIIGFLWFASQQSYGTVMIPFLSGVLGFLLKTLSDSITTSQRRQWDLDDFARDQTIKYYDSKLNEMSLFLINESEQLASFKWKTENGKMRIFDDNWQITREWLNSSATIRTFAKTLDVSEITEGYKKTSYHVKRLGELTADVNAGKFDARDQDELKTILRKEISDYMEAITAFQLSIELVRLKVLRGELSLKK